MNDSTFAQAFSRELDMEVRATRECLERIPMNLSDWKPHEKSMQLGYLAVLVAEIPLWITTMIRSNEIDFATFSHIHPTNNEELVAHFDENIAGAKTALAEVKDGDLEAPFYLKNNGQVVFQSSKKESLESTINHLVHHRGQLTVYLRLNDIAVPSIYGPSADSRPF
ncbi:DinB family protein [Niabella beijingensis]|uniref:DinB family protein n=1 Tax=Niabella beijingensis TaxID=2872700 RepID=UPI001CBC8010|nr:DinB family protein [Niabella beijingensis]MBZ4191270.1 DinB family protein [Niabella beijingensis]